ncbi:unnamed protein product, partial [Brachionus calyciflorus]
MYLSTRLIIVLLKYCIYVYFSICLSLVKANEDAKRLLDDLFSTYNPVVRPVADPSQTIRLSIGLKLSQIADIDEKNQIMTTNVWLRHEWFDHKLTWNPDHYGNTTKINVPSSNIWLPDVVLYNNADGDYQITTKTKATINYDGKIIWEPPMIYKSYCSINIEYYPFDIQDCYMKFGTWTFDGKLIDLEHINSNNSIREVNPVIRKGGISTKVYTVETGIDMSDYYQSVEWDVLSIPAQKNIKNYDCCAEPYYDIYFNITIRRKTLFYTVNLIIPCVNISFLSVLVFYLPSDSGEKLTLGISILVALLVFYLLLIELIPPTSLVIPLLGKYLLFTLILVNLSILLTIFILNLHHRKPNTHKMPFWMKRLFIEILPKLLMIERPMMARNSYDETLKLKNYVPCFDTSNLMGENNEELNSDLKRKFSKQKSVSVKSLESNEKSNYPKNISDAF